MRSRHRWLIALLLIPNLAVLWVPLYNHRQPVVAGFPWFYVWQVLWVVLAALFTWWVMRRSRT